MNTKFILFTTLLSFSLTSLIRGLAGTQTIEITLQITSSNFANNIQIINPNFDNTTLTTKPKMQINGKDSEYLAEINPQEKGYDIGTTLQIKYLFNTPLSTIYAMFQNSKELNFIKFSNFDSGNNITSISYAFEGCTSLTSVDLTNFISSNLSSTDHAFKSCSSLVNLVVHHQIQFCLEKHPIFHWVQIQSAFSKLIFLNFLHHHLP